MQCTATRERVHIARVYFAHRRRTGLRSAWLPLSVLAAGWVGIVEADYPTSGTNCRVVETLKGTKVTFVYS